LNFDLSVIEIFTALLSGATLVVPTAAERTDPSLIVRLLADEAVTVWSSTPALFRPVTDLAARAGALPAGLRTVLLAGDRFPPSMAATLAELGRDVTAYNVAGMTEVSCCSLVYEVRPSDAARDAMPWGEVLDRHVSYVLDDAQQPVPAGAPGELYIGGAGVGMGYWDRPDLTKERFVPDPFAGGDAVMYKTGDLVRRVTDGGLEFLGRLDGQVKVRGVRVEAGEIESALEQHPQIQQAAVVAREARVGENVLVGYVVPEPGVLLSAAQCREHLLTTVPVHSVPSQFFFLSGLPLSPNGKVDRQALPFPQPGSGPDGSGPDGSGPDGSGPDGARHSPGPVGAQHSVGPPDDQAGALCATVIRMWEEVLGRQHIGAHDSFFDLGGHSLHAMEIVARVRGELAATTRLSDLMDRPTPAAYAAHLEPTVRAPLSSVR
jgi:acyl-CoA synthetase (AMP-forming)/AMP-acid ligase II